MNPESPLHPSRLSPSSVPILPLRRAENLTRCELYWLPAAIPARQEQRKWTMSFISALAKRLGPKGEVQTELFVEAEALYPERQEQFVQTALDFNPIMGFSRTPGAPLPSIPKDQDVESIRKQEKPFSLKPFLHGICYWFLFKQPQKQLDFFWGLGGMTALMMKPDPAANAPAMAIPAGVMKHPAYEDMNKKHDIKGLLDTSFSLQSAFLKKSKEHFGKGWEDRVEYRGLMYVLPRWSSQDFFNLPEDEIKNLFEICDIYISESPVDQGVLLASSKPLQDHINHVIDELKQEGLVFP